MWKLRRSVAEKLPRQSSSSHKRELNNLSTCRHLKPGYRIAKFHWRSRRNAFPCRFWSRPNILTLQEYDILHTTSASKVAKMILEQIVETIMVNPHPRCEQLVDAPALHAQEQLRVTKTRPMLTIGNAAAQVERTLQDEQQVVTALSEPLVTHL